MKSFSSDSEVVLVLEKLKKISENIRKVNKSNGLAEIVWRTEVKRLLQAVGNYIYNLLSRNKFVFQFLVEKIFNFS